MGGMTARRSSRHGVCLVGVLGFISAGCSPFRVHVDCNLIDDPSHWTRLNGPAYVIRGENEKQESTLAFQQFANLLELALEHERPDLRREPAGEPAHLILTLSYGLVDRGAGIETRPVYGRVGFYGGYGYRYRYYGHYTRVGTRVDTVHLGFAHCVSITAWIPDDSDPDQRLILWEGYCDHAGRQRSLKETMPYLLAALVPYYGQATGGMESFTVDDDDALVEALRRHVRPVRLPEAQDHGANGEHGRD